MQKIFIFLLFASWISYFFLHSLAASNSIKRWANVNFPRFSPYYRLTYNILAIILLIPALAVLYMNQWVTVWQWPSEFWWLQQLLGIGSLLAFVLSFKMYDGMDFLGISQARNRLNHTATFQISIFHRFVRHP